MITLHTLKDYIIKFINSNDSSIIYFSTGSYCHANKYNEELDTYIRHWGFEENQQFPPFLHDFKFKHLDVPILIILIDPSFNDNQPYIVSSSDNFLDKSWTTSQEFLNLYLSSFRLNVIKISDKISWGDKFIESQTDFNFEKLMIELCEYISNQSSNSVLFYHEFTGSNVILFEHLVRKNTIKFDPNKICIDITRGADMSCYFNLSNPEFYPIITYDELNKLKYINPDMLTNDYKTHIIEKYKKFTHGFNDNLVDCIFSKFNCNYLFQTPHEIILCFQIIKNDQVILNYISNRILSLIRYFYVCGENKDFNLKIWGIQHIISLKNYIQNKFSVEYLDYKYTTNSLNTLNIVVDNIKLIDEINQNKFSNNPNDHNYNENIKFLKNEIIFNLYLVIKEILTDIIIKYQINIFEVDELITELRELKDKYNMIDVYKKFILKFNIQ
jgi:hypothetical protein